jgi:hypothetical protein
MRCILITPFHQLLHIPVDATFGLGGQGIGVLVEAVSANNGLAFALLGLRGLAGGGRDKVTSLLCFCQGREAEYLGSGDRDRQHTGWKCVGACP